MEHLEKNKLSKDYFYSVTLLWKFKITYIITMITSAFRQSF